MLHQQLPVQRMRRVYVWELPVRIYHWINVLVMLTLIATGFFIANPLALQSQHEATGKFTMGWFRYIHFAAAYIFLFNYIFRLYWSFVGNKYANWRQFIPTNFKFIKELWVIFKVDILMIRNKEHVAVGHNAMAGFIYFFAFLASLVQILTGFGLYASTASWWFPRLFAWVPALLGGDILTRQVHHWTMWFFILFAVIHIYLVFYHDYIEGRGEMSSMAGGYKFMEDEKFEPATPAPVETPVAEVKTNPDKMTTTNAK